MIKLNLGCGDKILEGYVNVDVIQERAGRHPDVNCDIRKLEVFPENYCDEILAVHVVEHFWRWEVEAVLKEWIRVLKPGSKMILECPNLITASKSFSEIQTKLLNLAQKDKELCGYSMGTQDGKIH